MPLLLKSNKADTSVVFTAGKILFQAQCISQSLAPHNHIVWETLLNLALMQQVTHKNHHQEHILMTFWNALKILPFLLKFDFHIVYIYNTII